MSYQLTRLVTLTRPGARVTDGACAARFWPTNRIVPPTAASARPAPPRPVRDSFDTDPDVNSPPLVWRNPYTAMPMPTAKSADPGTRYALSTRDGGGVACS